jgi:hypothetical protein
MVTSLKIAVWLALVVLSWGPVIGVIWLAQCALPSQTSPYPRGGAAVADLAEKDRA